MSMMQRFAISHSRDDNGHTVLLHVPGRKHISSYTVPCPVSKNKRNKILTAVTDGRIAPKILSWPSQSVTFKDTSQALRLNLALPHIGGVFFLGEAVSLKLVLLESGAVSSAPPPSLRNRVETAWTLALASASATALICTRNLFFIFSRGTGAAAAPSCFAGQ